MFNFMYFEINEFNEFNEINLISQFLKKLWAKLILYYHAFA